jgi:hypothetical protein
MFVKTISGHYYPLASVESFWEAQDESGQKLENVKLKDGSTERLSPGEINRVLEASAHPFTAARDTYVLHHVLDDNNRLTLERAPVLGWIVSPSRGVLPVTIEGINHGLDATAPVLMPNGEVVLAMNCTYANEQCYFYEVRSADKVS